MDFHLPLPQLFLPGALAVLVGVSGRSVLVPLSTLTASSWKTRHRIHVADIWQDTVSRAGLGHYCFSGTEITFQIHELPMADLERMIRITHLADSAHFHAQNTPESPTFEPKSLTNTHCLHGVVG